MRHAFVVLAALAAPVSSASARTQVEVSRDDVTTPTMIVARLWSAFDAPLVPRGIVDQVVRWRLGLRDLMHGASLTLATLAESTGVRIPDLTVLTTQPVPSSSSAWATSGFGWRDDPIRHRSKFHKGADVRAKPGTPVVAAGDGVVVFAGRQGGYGNVIHVNHGGGVVTRYAHLRRIETTRNAVITAGQQIGQVGSTGRATGPHLHFEVRLDGRAVDPGTAMAVAELGRESPEAGRVAAFALSPEMQALERSDLDPPRTRTQPKGSRPERTGRIKRVRPVS